jgi:hypothetical protein
MNHCYRCGGEIIFRRRTDDDEVILIHLDGSCRPAIVRYVAVAHVRVISFRRAVLGKEILGIVLNVADRRVHVGALGDVACPLRTLLACDLKVAHTRGATRVYLPYRRRPSVRTVILVRPFEVKLRDEVGRTERALYAELFQMVEAHH